MIIVELVVEVWTVYLVEQPHLPLSSLSTLEPNLKAGPSQFLH